MSRTFKQQRTRETDYKMDDKYNGYGFESAYAQEGRKFVKRLVNKHNRRLNRQVIDNEIDEAISEINRLCIEMQENIYV